MHSESSGVLIQRGISEGIGFYRVGGVFTPQSAPHVLATNHEWLTAERLPAQIVSYERAALAVTPDEIFQAARAVIGASKTGGMLTPTALLVSRGDLPMWRAYCWMMAQAGVARAAFVTEDLARQWAAEAGALWAAQQRHRQHGQSPR